MRTIVHATSTDAKTIAALVNSAYRGDSSRKGWTTEADLLDGTRTNEQNIISLIETPGTIILKCVEHNTIISCVELQFHGKEMYLGMLTVNPQMQAAGIGKMMLEASEFEARKNHCDKINMTVISSRVELIEWYKRRGYSDTGKRKPFAFTDPQFGIPKQSLEFIILEKQL